jgi:hypothetical protein
VSCYTPVAAALQFACFAPAAAVVLLLLHIHTRKGVRVHVLQERCFFVTSVMNCSAAASLPRHITLLVQCGLGTCAVH